MANDPIPYTIEAMLEQIGHRTLGSALIYCGATKPVWRHPQVPTAELGYSCRPSRPSHFSPDQGAVAEVSLHFGVNGTPGENWSFTISYEQDDTYTVYFTRRAVEADKSEAFSIAMEIRPDVYCEDLRDLICRLYDEALQTRNGGFLPL